MLDQKGLLKQYRIKTNQTQQEIANQLGYSHSYISKLERGIIPLNNKFLTKLYNTFDIKELQIPYQNSSTNQLFHNWFTSLSNHHKRKSEQFLQELQKKFPITQATNDFLLYNLYRFYHLTLEHNISEAQALLPRIIKNSLHLTSSGLFLFYKAIAYHYIQTDQLSSAAEALKNAQKHMEGNDSEYYLFCAMLKTKMKAVYESNEYLQETEQLLRVNFDLSKTMLVRIMLSINQIQQHNYEQAKKGFHQIIDTAYHKEYMIKTELIYYFLAKIHYLQNNYEEALRFLRHAKVKEKVPYFKVIYLYLTAKIYWKLNRKNDALAYISNIQRLRVNQKYQYKAMLLKRDILHLLETDDTKILLLDTIIPFYQRNEDFPEEYKCYRLLQDICYKMKMYKQSADYLKKMIIIREQASNYRIYEK